MSEVKQSAMLAAPAQPAARQEPVVHACANCAACEGSPASNNNPCYICGGTVSAAQNQSEVQRLREERDTYFRITVRAIEQIAWMETENNTLRQQRDKLAGLLDQVTTEVGRTITSELREEIEAALAEIKL